MSRAGSSGRRLAVMTLGALLILFAVLPYAVLGKTISGTFQLDAGDLYRGPEKELTKFSFVIGRGRIEGMFTYQDPQTWMTSPGLYLYRDESWEEYMKAPACEEKTMLAFKAITVGQQTSSHTGLLHRKLDDATKTEMRALPNGVMEWSFEWEFDTEERTRGWFLVAADCALEQFNAQVPPMSYVVRLYNPGDTHLPADEFGLPKLYLLVFTALTVVSVYGVRLQVAARASTNPVNAKDDSFAGAASSSTKTHLVVWLLAFAIVTLLSSVACELGHLWFYKYNGTGLFILDLLSDLLDGISQLTVAFVLICLASGWTLVEYDDDVVRSNSVGSMLRHPGQMLRGANKGVFAIIALVTTSIVLQVLNKLGDEDFTKFHDYETRSGTLLVLLHTLLGVGFVASLLVTIRHETKRASGGSGGNNNDRLVIFLRRLLLFGGMWFLIFPVLVTMASGMAHYNRHRFVTGGTLIVQTICLVSMTHQFASSKSTYYKISRLAEVGVLPGAGGLVKPSKMSRD